MVDDLLGSARNIIKCSSLYFTGRIRYGTKGEKVDERLLVKEKKKTYKIFFICNLFFKCMDAVKVSICSIKIPVKV
jgi:hypothetical protein